MSKSSLTRKEEYERMVDLMAGDHAQDLWDAINKARDARTAQPNAFGVYEAALVYHIMMVVIRLGGRLGFGNIFLKAIPPEEVRGEGGAEAPDVRTSEL